MKVPRVMAITTAHYSIVMPGTILPNNHFSLVQTAQLYIHQKSSDRNTKCIRTGNYDAVLHSNNPQPTTLSLSSFFKLLFDVDTHAYAPPNIQTSKRRIKIVHIHAKKRRTRLYRVNTNRHRLQHTFRKT